MRLEVAELFKRFAKKAADHFRTGRFIIFVSGASINGVENAPRDTGIYLLAVNWRSAARFFARIYS